MVNYRRTVALRNDSYRKNAIKFLFKKNILKSVITNFKAVEASRVKAYIQTIRVKYKYTFSRSRNVCSVSGKCRGVGQPFNLSRHWIKRYAKMGKLTNLRIKSW